MENRASDLWEQALAVLKNEIDEDSFMAWLQPTMCIACDEATLTIGVPNEVARNWLASHYMGRIASAVESVAERSVEIDFQVREDRNRATAAADPFANRRNGREIYRASQLNLNYSFDNFVVGESNRFAFATARAVSSPRNTSFNPLFIYGGVGLGKTHLMQAIGHEYRGQTPDSAVLYVTSEQFMNAFVDSVTRGASPTFRTFYRNVDLLLIDDVQFFMGKEGTQTEFFHTFNTLYESGRKIVVTSDRPPKELNHLEERLRSRFEWGLIVDIQPPDLETRMAILRAKAAALGIELPYDQAIYIAERIKTNVRKLEGVVQQIRAHMDLYQRPVTRDEVARFLQPFMVGEEPKKIDPDRVARAVCDYFDIEPEDLRGKSRLRKHAFPRHIAMFLCRRLAKLSYPEIGQFYGGRDHSSVMHGCRNVESRVQADMNVQNLVTYLTKKIQDSVQA